MSDWEGVVKQLDILNARSLARTRIAEFDSASIIEFPLHKARKPLAEPAEHGSAIIRTLVACDMDRATAEAIVRAEPLPQVVPVMTTDAEAEAFMAKDLSNLDWSQFKPIDDGA
jgi:hypothetical protein